VLGPATAAREAWIGWVDAHLLASALTSSAVLWSVDADLSAVAADLGICWPA
jgi:hypothetical protein